MSPDAKASGMRGATVERGWAIARLAAALLITAALVAQANQTIGGAAQAGRDVATTAVNFFSFFTVLSNVGGAIVLTWAAVRLWRAGRPRTEEPRALALALAAATTYMVVTGIVYNLLLRSIELPQGATVPWSNEVLHLIGPLFFLVDLLFAPRRRRLPWSAIGAILVFPVLWLAYTMVRGGLVTNPVTGAPFWYPYPFLDPNGPGGYPSVVLYAVAIAATLAVSAGLVILVGRLRTREEETK